MVPPADDCPLPTPLVSGAAGFLLLISACNAPIVGGQTGDLSGAIPEPEGEVPNFAVESDLGCEYTTSDVDRDAETPLGFSPKDVLDFAEGTFETDIAWHRDPYSGIGYGPEDEGGLSLSVKPRGHTARLLEPVTNDAGVGPTCSPLLAIPVDLTVTSEGGALDELIVTQLQVSTTELAHFDVNIPAEELDGALYLRNAPPGAELLSVQLSGFVSSLGTAGSVDVTYGEATKPGAETEIAPAPMSAMAAHWPKESCDDASLGYVPPGLVVEEDTELRGESFVDLLDTVRDFSPVPLRWSDGSETQLRFELERTGQVCASDVGGVLRARGDVSVSFVTDDGAIEGSLPGRVSDDSGASDQRWLSLSSNVQLSPADFLERVTLDGIRVEQYEQVLFGFYLSGDDAPAGSLSISGTMACDIEPPEPELSAACSAPVADAGLGSLEESSDPTFE